MGASAQQIASARALAQSRGYDPNLVDADNADRANNAFPTQGGGYTGGAGYKPPSSPVVAPGAGSPTMPAPPPGSVWGTPGSNPGQTGGTAPTGSTPGMEALNKVVENPMEGLSMSLGALGGGGSVGNQERTGAVDEASSGMYRPLGRRNMPQSMLVLGRKAY